MKIIIPSMKSIEAGYDSVLYMCMSTKIMHCLNRSLNDKRMLAEEEATKRTLLK